jgi:E3 ubiquitin-protein ligase RNF19A
LTCQFYNILWLWLFIIPKKPKIYRNLSILSDQLSKMFVKCFSNHKFIIFIIHSHRLEVQADVSSSETASAVTCVSEKSGGNLSNDTASTRALAGSILSYKNHTDSSNVSEDGERVRFDSNVYLIDDKKEPCDMWYSDGCPEKASLGSGRSFRGSERSFRDDLDTSSLCSVHKRLTNLTQRIPKLNNSQHRTLSVESGSGASNNIPENASLEQLELIPPAPQPMSTPPLPPKVLSNSSDSPELPQATSTGDDANTEAATNQPDTAKDKSSKNMSKSNVLRNLFFFQNENGSSKS